MGSENAFETIETVRQAVPARFDVEGNSNATDSMDCCARLVRVAPVADRDAAAAWLPFLRALGLVTEVNGTYVRTDADIDPESVRAAFRDRIYRADEVLQVVETMDVSLDVADVADRVEMASGESRSGRTIDRDRLGRLFKWALAFGIIEREDDGYR